MFSIYSSYSESIASEFIVNHIKNMEVVDNKEATI